MMCGTPVAASRLGAAAEIVDEGVSGAMANSLDDLPGAVESALTIDRAGVRETAERRFSAQRMAQDYAAVYREALPPRS